MDGYDGSISGSFYALPSFTKFFGTYTGINAKTGLPVYVLDANIMSAVSFVGIPGGFIGLWLCGWCQERFGSRKTYFWGMFACICVTFLFVFAQNLTMLLVAQALAAGCWALFNTLSAAYAIEICPIQLRGLATSFISMW
jgi:SP family general alpha glucoside:H+ symporter-like MFS transporter